MVKRHHEATFQLHQAVWDQEFDESNKNTFETIKGVFSRKPWSLRFQKLIPIEEETVDSKSDF